jgi:hypothetical protein
MVGRGASRGGAPWLGGVWTCGSSGPLSGRVRLWNARAGGRGEGLTRAACGAPGMAFRWAPPPPWLRGIRQDDTTPEYSLDCEIRDRYSRGFVSWLSLEVPYLTEREPSPIRGFL